MLILITENKSRFFLPITCRISALIYWHPEEGLTSTRNTAGSVINALTVAIPIPIIPAEFGKSVLSTGVE